MSFASSDGNDLGIYIVVLPVTAFKDPAWDSIGDELWPIIAINFCTLYIYPLIFPKGCVAPTGTRDSTLEILIGDNGWVNHCENGILYSFNATKCMFSWGNLSEKLRMAGLDCTDEVIVDLFAGIGYFVLPFLVRPVIDMEKSVVINHVIAKSLAGNYSVLLTLLFCNSFMEEYSENDNDDDTNE
ncbi:hypothetical protein Q3G72_028149 [Acer saccharum]|nr:hypothetical protein Q3G72_028149 [Acer saccharum]